MKYRKTVLIFAYIVSAFTAVSWRAGAGAQTPGANLPFNPFRVTFTRRWSEKLTDKVKLFDVLPDEKRGGLAFVVESGDRDALKRRLLMTHWDGFKFAADASADFIGATPDTLLVGKFREAPAPPLSAPAITPPKKSKKIPPSAAKSQVITTEGVYDWDGKLLNRLYPAPAGVRFALEIEGRGNRFAGGSGNETAQYTLTDVGPKPLPTFDAPLESGGFARSGIGAQDFLHSEQSNLPSGARYLQSYWLNRSRWMIALLHTENGAGDTLIVYAPKYGGKEKSFWSSTFDDFEEVWRSGAMPGRILDARIGDPKNENTTGLIVLTSTNNGQDRTLTFFTPTK